MSNVLSLLVRRATMMSKPSGGGGLLPSGYTQYDWVQCDNYDINSPSYIPIDLYPNRSQDWAFEGSFARSAAIGTDYKVRGIFTRYLATNYGSNYYLGYKARAQATLCFNYNSLATSEANAYNVSTSIDIGEWHTFKMEGDTTLTYGGKCSLDGGEAVQGYNAQPSNDTTAELKLIACYPCRLARFKVSYQGALVADLVPCTRDSDSTAGFYDVVRSTFYAPTGSATFTAGNGLEDFTS